MLQKAVPIALKKGKPGTPEFRAALKDAFETMGRTPVSQGVLNWTPTDHFGYTPETGVLLKVVNGDWQVVPLALGGYRRGGPRPPSRGRCRTAWTSPSPASCCSTASPTAPSTRLLALAIVLVFAVTRVIFIPQGEFVAYGALTLAHAAARQGAGHGLAAAGAGGRSPR